MKTLLKASAGLLALTMASTTDATTFFYQAVLTGAAENPANASPGTGFTLATYDNVAHTLHLSIAFSGLTGPTTASHIHAPTALPFMGTAGVATTTPTFAGFPLGVTSGGYDATLDLTAASSYNPAFITANGGTTAGAEAALTASIAAGLSYLNIHTSAFPGGEIRGFLTAVPEPASWALMIGGFALAGATLRRQGRATMPA
jgi:hypothetical protein